MKEEYKEKAKQIFNFFKEPSLGFSVLCYALFFAFTAVTLVLVGIEASDGVLVAFYSGMGVTFFYCAYLFIRFDYRRIRNSFRRAKVALSAKSKLMDKVFNDVYFRTMLGTSFSLFLGICFVAYNAVAGFHYHSIWNASIAIYYGLLVAIRVLFLAGEFRISHSSVMSEGGKELKRAKMFRLEGVLLLFVNIALIVPVTLLATIQKDVNLGMWVAIANACYTFYNVIVCIYSFVKTRKSENLSVQGIKNLNLTSACISLLALENTMIITFSEEIESGMKTLIILSAFAVTVINLVVAIITLRKGKKQVERLTSSQSNTDKV